MLKEESVSLTVKELVFVPVPAASGPLSINFRGSSYDLAVGSFSAYPATNSVIIRSLGAMYEFVSFPFLSV
jgi:hypothetical protein